MQREKRAFIGGFGKMVVEGEIQLKSYKYLFSVGDKAIFKCDRNYLA